MWPRSWFVAGRPVHKKSLLRNVPFFRAIAVWGDIGRRHQVIDMHDFFRLNKLEKKKKVSFVADMDI
jgi:hypothetical protein